MDVTERLASFVAQYRYEALSAGALETARTAILDSVGVMLAGSQREESALICAQLAREERAEPSATLIGAGFKSSAVQAAFVNGVALHACDFDHSFVIGGQPTAPVIPATLALAETLGSSGQHVLEAYAVGFEVTSRLAFAALGTPGGGWHANGVLGAFGAAAACCKLLGLDADKVGMALGITASMASGLSVNFGTMTKPLHVGLAARNGVLAAQLARATFTANPQALEAKNGFLNTLYPRRLPADAELDDLGRVSALEKHAVQLKAYPCGGLTHTAIYAAIALRNQHGIDVDAVDHVDVDVPRGTYNTIAFRVPETALQGKFCMGYLIARAFRDGNVTLDTFTEEAVRDVNVLALGEKVSMRADPDLYPGQDGSRPARVTISLRNGDVFTLHAAYPKGSIPQFPMSQQEIHAKFRECARGVIDDGATENALALLQRLETVDDISVLTSLLMRG